MRLDCGDGLASFPDQDQDQHQRTSRTISLTRMETARACCCPFTAYGYLPRLRPFVRATSASAGSAPRPHPQHRRGPDDSSVGTEALATEPRTRSVAARSTLPVGQPDMGDLRLTRRMQTVAPTWTIG